MATILQNHYVLAVHDLQASAGFFVDQLGFKMYAEPPGWIFVKKDQCMIMMGDCQGDLHPSKLGSHNYFGYLRVDDVNGYHEELRAKGVTIVHPIADKPWRMREFGVQTPEGHRLMIGQWLDEPAQTVEGT